MSSQYKWHHLLTFCKGNNRLFNLLNMSHLNQVERCGIKFNRNEMKYGRNLKSKLRSYSQWCSRFLARTVIFIICQSHNPPHSYTINLFLKVIQYQRRHNSKYKGLETVSLQVLKAHLIKMKCQWTCSLNTNDLMNFFQFHNLNLSQNLYNFKSNNDLHNTANL